MLAPGELVSASPSGLTPVWDKPERSTRLVVSCGNGSIIQLDVKLDEGRIGEVETYFSTTSTSGRKFDSSLPISLHQREGNVKVLHPIGLDLLDDGEVDGASG